MRLRVAADVDSDHPVVFRLRAPHPCSPPAPADVRFWPAHRPSRIVVVAPIIRRLRRDPPRRQCRCASNTPYRGVRLRQLGRCVAKITCDGRRRWLGTFVTPSSPRLLTVWWLGGTASPSPSSISLTLRRSNWRSSSPLKCGSYPAMRRETATCGSGAQILRHEEHGAQEGGWGRTLKGDQDGKQGMPLKSDQD